MTTWIACLCLLVLFAGVTASAQTSGGSASGTLTINGKTYPLKYAYAIPGEMGYEPDSKKISVLITDAPLQGFDIEDVFAVMQLAKQGKLHGLALRLDDDHSLASTNLFDGILGDASFTITGMVTFKPTRIDAKGVAGKFTCGEEESNDLTFQFSGAFDAPRYQRPAPAVGADAADSGPGKVVTAFLTALLKKDKVTLAKLTDPEFAEIVNGPQGDELIQMLAQDISPKTKVAEVTEIGDVAIVGIGANGKKENELRAERVNGAWRIKK